MDDNLASAWKMIWEQLYSPETHLFYDCIPAGPKFGTLPDPGEIARSFPNACGWGTGMEDSMLSAGAVMDILQWRKNLTGDPEAGKLAAEVLQGMDLAATVHGVPGFAARSVSPKDGKSCYINSSRDQFTLAAYGAWRCMRNFPELKPQVREYLVRMAQYCEKNVTAENDWNLMRLDGKKGLVCKMCKAAPHEELRLPMIYAAAYEASGDAHWRDLALQFAEPAADYTLTMDQTGLWWWDITVSQLGISLAVLDAIPVGSQELHAKYRNALGINSRHTAELLETMLNEAEAFSGDWTCHAPDWRTLPRVRRKEPAIPSGDGMFEGLLYENPVRPEEFHAVMEYTRGLGNLVFALSLDPAAEIKPEAMSRYMKLLLQMDFNNMAVDGVIQLQQGYWGARSRGWVKKNGNAYRAGI